MKIVTIKIGSSVLFTQRNKLDEFRIAHIADQILALMKKDIGVILVVSGAVACGANVIPFSSGDKLLKRAAAGIGQTYLIAVFQQIFAKKGLKIAQILLTNDLFNSENRTKNISELIYYYLGNRIIPVINENDVIELNSFGGNDFLGAKIVTLLQAESLIILSTMDGSKFSVGGGKAKFKAAAMLEQKNIPTNIVNGKTKNILLETLL